MDGRAAILVAIRPLVLVSTKFWTWDTLLNRLRSVAITSWPEPTQGVADWPRGWANRSALVPLLLVVWPHMVYMSETFL
jgi:hypothetical protein